MLLVSDGGHCLGFVQNAEETRVLREVFEERAETAFFHFQRCAAPGDAFSDKLE